MLVKPNVAPVLTRIALKLPEKTAARVTHYAAMLSAAHGQNVSLDETVALLLDYAMNKDTGFVRQEKVAGKVPKTPAVTPNF